MATEFLQQYLGICQERGVDPNATVQQCLKRPCASPGINGKSVLNLQISSLDEKTCEILGKLLSLDHHFEHINFSDCALSENAVSSLICGLNTNTTCKTANLKGNNIRSKAVECLGRLLRQNTNIECLVLEWNALGMLEDSFMAFCEGLGGNCSLVSLDLRNNQISHHGATELATALKRNTTLKRLDLRWNSIGLVGGKALLDTFKFNRTIERLELQGNDIPHDLIKSIENSVRSNADLNNLSDEYQARTKRLTSELNRTKQESALQLDHLMGQLDDKEDMFCKSNRIASRKLEHFKEQLEERKSSFNAMASKLARAESELLLSQQRVKDLEILLDKEREDKQAISCSYRGELRTAQDQHNILEAKMTAQVNELTEGNKVMSQQVEGLQRESENRLKEVFSLKEKNAELQSDARIAATNHQDQLRKEQAKHSDHVRQLNIAKDKEIEQIRGDYAVVEKSLRDQVTKLEQQKREQEEETAKMKALLITERMKAEEDMAQCRQKMKADQDFHMQHMQDKLKLVQSAKDEVQQMSSSQACIISDLQTKNSSLTMSNDNLRRQVESLQQNVAMKNQDIEQAKQRVQQQMNERLNEREKENELVTAQRDKLANSEKKLENQISKLEETVEKKNIEIKHLQEKLAMKEADITWMRQETAQRGEALHAAVRNYIRPLSASS